MKARHSSAGSDGVRSEYRRQGTYTSRSTRSQLLQYRIQSDPQVRPAIISAVTNGAVPEGTRDWTLTYPAWLSYAVPAALEPSDARNLRFQNDS